MKIQCSGLHFAEALGIASMIAPSRGTIPILQNIKIVADKDTVHLYATDLDVMLHYKVGNVEVLQQGAVTLPALRTTSIFREMEKDTVSMEVDGQAAKISGKNSEFKVLGIDPAEFPEFPASKSEASFFEIPKEDFIDMINKTAFAVSLESTHKYALSGVLMEVKGNELRMVGSDGKRLALCRKKLPGKDKNKDSIRVIAPPKSLRLIEKIVLKDEKTVKCLLEENQLKIQTQNAEIVSKLIEGSFPDYDAVIPKDNDIKLTLKTGEFHNCIRQASLMTNPEQGKAVKIQLSKNRMTLFTRVQDVGESTVEMPPVSYNKAEFSVVFNPDYVVDALRAAGTEEITLELKDSQTAGIIKAGKDFTYLVMPLAVPV